MIDILKDKMPKEPEIQERDYPEVIEVKTKGKSGKVGILEDITDMLGEHDYHEVAREQTGNNEITNIYQHEKAKDEEHGD